MNNEPNLAERSQMADLIDLCHNLSRFALRALGFDIDESSPPAKNEKLQLSERMIEWAIALRAGTTTTRKTDSNITSNDSTNIHEKTRNLLEALGAISQQLPSVASAIAHERISPQDQVEFANLVIRIGELVKLHAWEVRGYE